MKSIQLKGALAVLAAILLTGFQNCGRFESEKMSSASAGNSTGGMTQAQARELGAGQRFATSLADLPAICQDPNYAMVLKYLPQCQVADERQNPIASVYGGIASRYANNGAHFMSFTVDLGLASMEDIQIRLEYHLASSPEGEVRSTKLVDALSLGQDWIRDEPLTLPGVLPNGQPVLREMQTFYTFVPAVSYLAKGTYTLYVQTRDGEFARSATFTVE